MTKAETRINLKVPDALHHEATVVAAENRISLQDLCKRGLERIIAELRRKRRGAA